VKASLKRLQLGHIDPYQIHGFDAVTPVEEPCAVGLVGCSAAAGRRAAPRVRAGWAASPHPARRATVPRSRTDTGLQTRLCADVQGMRLHAAVRVDESRLQSAVNR